MLTTGQFLTIVTVDGELLPDDPESLLKEGKVNKADIITGMTANEGGFAIYVLMDKEFTADVFQTALKIDLSLLGMYSKRVEEAVLFEYLQHSDLNNSDEMRQAAIDESTELMFLAPAVVEAKLFAKTSNHVYLYVFDHSAHQPKPSEEWLGAHHALDLAFTFGFPLSEDSLEDYISFLLPGNYSALEQELSKYVMEMWANFAKYGDPNGVGAVPVKWPAYNNSIHAHLSISTDPKVKYSLPARKVTFWNEFIPKLTRIKHETPLS